MKAAIRKLKQKVSRLVFTAALGVAQAAFLVSAQAPNIQVQPEAFQGSQSLIQLLDYAMYAAWIFVIGLIIYAVFEMRNGVLSEGVKRALGGAIGAAFLLTFGWAIISGAI